MKKINYWLCAAAILVVVNVLVVIQAKTSDVPASMLLSQTEALATDEPTGYCYQTMGYCYVNGSWTGITYKCYGDYTADLCRLYVCKEKC